MKANHQRCQLLGARRQNPARRLIKPLLVITLIMLSSCASEDPAEAEATPNTITGNIQSVVTRIAEQIIVPTPTPDPAATPVVDRDPVALDISLIGRLPNLDPAQAQSETQLDLAQNLFIGLTNFNPDTNSIEPELATEWEVGPDGRTWTFKLRDDIFWVRQGQRLPSEDALADVQSVRPVVADDVVFAIQRLCSRDVDSPSTFSLFVIEGCETLYRKPEPTEVDRAAIGIRALDEATLEIRLTQPASYFLTLTSMPLFQPVPRDLVTELGDQWQTDAGREGTGWQIPANILTSGPFFPVVSKLTSQSLILHRNPRWPIEKVGNVDIVNVYFQDEEADAFALWQDYILDLAPLPASERDSFLRRSPEKAILIPEAVLFYVGFNFGSEVFQEPALRRAFSAAIDREALISQIYNESGLSMRHATVPGIVASIPVGEVGVGYSPDYARQQMAASSVRNCRLMAPVTMLVSSADLSMRQAELIRDMWVEELDCLKENITIEQVQFGELLARTRPDAVNRPDMWELAWAPAYPDAHNFLNDLLHCTGSENRQNRPCAEVDTLQQQGSTTQDQAVRATLYRQVETLFFGENGLFPIAPLYIRARYFVLHDWVTTFTPVILGGQQWDRIMLDSVLKDLERSRRR